MAFALASISALERNYNNEAYIYCKHIYFSLQQTYIIGYKIYPFCRHGFGTSIHVQDIHVQAIHVLDLVQIFPYQGIYLLELQQIEAGPIK